MTRTTPRPGSDAYIVCVGLPAETVAQVVHALGGQHPVLVVPDSDSAVNLLAPHHGTGDTTPSSPASPAFAPASEAVSPHGPPRHAPSAHAPSAPEHPAATGPDGGRVLAFPSRGRPEQAHPARRPAVSYPSAGPSPLTGATRAVGTPPSGQVPAVTGAVPAVTGAFPLVPPDQREPIRHGPLTLDLSAREVRVQDREVHLSAQEFDLIATLASRPGRVWTFAELTAQVWGTRYLGDADAVTSAIKRLRRRLPRVRGLEVASVRGVGYRLRVPE